MNVRFNGTRLVVLSLLLCVLKLVGVLSISYWWVFAPILSPIFVSLYLILFTC